MVVRPRWKAVHSPVTVVPSFAVPAGLSDNDPVIITSPDLKLGWTSNIVDFTLQTSKKFLFLIPYLGAGLSVGSSSVTGGVESSITTTYTGGLEQLRADIIAAGGTPPDFSATGFSYTSNVATPVFRVYGGLSLRILVDLDLQAMYVPATKSLGASATLRFQI